MTARTRCRDLATPASLCSRRCLACPAPAPAASARSRIPRRSRAGTADEHGGQAPRLDQRRAREPRAPAAAGRPTGFVDLAGDRAATMARTGEIEHPDCLCCLLKNRDISFDRCGEVIACTTYPWGHEAARSIFNGWKGSSGALGHADEPELPADRHRGRVPELQNRLDLAAARRSLAALTRPPAPVS